MSRSIAMFAKAPVPGDVKTRLGADVGEEMAARYHAAFIADLAATVASVDARHVLAFAGDPEHAGFAPVRERGFAFVEQPAIGLGGRLDRIIRREARDSDAVVVIGSDSPTLQRRHLEDAFDRLETADVVVGPSFDGGYYLLGVRSGWYLETATADETHPLFDGIAWSTADVLDQTLSRCQQMSCLCDLTAFWYDVDTFEDLKLLATHLLKHLRPSGLELASNTAVLLAEQHEETSRTPTS